MRARVVVCITVLIGYVMALGAVISPPALASSGGVVISQLQTASTSDAAAEFVELHNTSSAGVAVTGWQLQYRAATQTNGTDCTKGWTTKATLPAATLAAGGYYLLAPSAYLTADASFNAGLATTGTVRLLDASKGTVDALAWGAASCGLGTAAAAPPAGQSLERQAGADGAHGDNAADFAIQPRPVAHSSASIFNLAPAPTPTPQLPAATPTLVPALGSPDLKLSELLIDPAPPATDSQDEFVELYNGGDAPAQLGGYIIKTGSHSYTLPAGELAPDDYMVITSANSTISLSNSGGVANLLDPTGTVIDTAGAWGSAVPGASWAFIGDTWRWTLTPTPGDPNQYTPVPGQGASDETADYAPVQLSELLPDPASPQTDAADEFIELYNPTDQAVDLAGYALKVGHDLSAKYVISDAVIAAGGYLALKSAVTKLALANAGSSVALYDPAGNQLGSTVTYAKAPTGQAWAELDGGWGWTAEPTPGAANVLVTPPAPPTLTKITQAKTAGKAKAVAKPKTTKVAKAAKVKAAKANSKPLLAGATTTGGRWLLIILAGLTIAYIIYEFRYDLRNYYFKLRGYPGGGPAAGRAIVGPGGNRAGE